jgi:hypothetical protein
MKKNVTKILLLCIAMICVSCSSDDNNNDNPSATFNPDEYLYYISGKINGEPFIFGQRIDATALDYSEPFYGNDISTPCAFNPNNGGLNYLAGVYPNLENEARPSMYFEFVRFYLCDPNFDNNPGETFNDVFPVRSYDVATSNSDLNGTTGAVCLSYNANSADNSLLYNSLNPDQTGNSFEITSSTDTSSVFLRRQTVEGNFSFKVYNEEDSSDVVEITEGQFKINIYFN